MTTKPRLHHCLIFVAGWIPNTSYFSFLSQKEYLYFCLATSFCIKIWFQKKISQFMLKFQGEYRFICCLFVDSRHFWYCGRRLGIFGVAISDQPTWPPTKMTGRRISFKERERGGEKLGGMLLSVSLSCDSSSCYFCLMISTQVAWRKMETERKVGVGGDTAAHFCIIALIPPNRTLPSSCIMRHYDSTSNILFSAFPKL